MKYLLSVLLLVASISGVWGDTYYKMDKKDYDEMIRQKCSLETDLETMYLAPEIKHLKQCKIDWIEDIEQKLKKESSDSIEKIINQKYETLEDKITLLEIKINKKGGKTNGN